MRLELDQAIPKRYAKRLLFAALASNSGLRHTAGLARMGQRLLVDILGTSSRLGNIPLAKFPRINGTSFRESITETVQPEGKRVGRVAYFTGCATDLIYADVGRSVLQVLGKLGIEVIIPRDQACCSAPLFLNGAVKQALPNILKNLEILDRVDADAIVVDCAACGAALKKGIPDLLEDLNMDTERASRVAEKVRDISQIVSERLDKLPIESIRSSEPLTVTYHDPCHLVRGMGITAEPRAMIRSLSEAKLVEMEGANECCGGGGFYQFDKVNLSGAITSRKMENIRATGAQVVLTGCPGCRLTLAGNISESEEIEVLHTIQLLSRYLL